MASLVVYLILALVFSYFATLNAGRISINLASYRIEHVPLYLALGAAILIGLLLSWLINLFDGFVSAMKIRGKEHTIKDDKKIIHELTKKVNQLEIENAKLTGQLKSEPNDPNSL